MVRVKLVPRRADRKRWPPKEPYVKYKIKTLLPEQKVVEIKRNGQEIRRITTRRKTEKFTDRWARKFLKNVTIATNWENMMQVPTQQKTVLQIGNKQKKY